jgi:hypothetical protein
MSIGIIYRRYTTSSDTLQLSGIFWKGFLMSVEFGKNIWEFVIGVRKGCLLVCYDMARAKVIHRKIPHLWRGEGLDY